MSYQHNTASLSKKTKLQCHCCISGQKTHHTYNQKTQIQRENILVTNVKSGVTQQPTETNTLDVEKSINGTLSSDFLRLKNRSPLTKEVRMSSKCRKISTIVLIFKINEETPFFTNRPPRQPQCTAPAAPPGKNPPT